MEDKNFIKYLQIPEYTRETQDNIYTRGWYVQTGMAIMAPHPHRHYNHSEFLIAYKHNEELRNFLKE